MRPCCTTAFCATYGAQRAPMGVLACNWLALQRKGGLGAASVQTHRQFASAITCWRGGSQPPCCYVGCFNVCPLAYLNVDAQEASCDSRSLNSAQLQLRGATTSSEGGCEQGCKWRRGR